jgi:type I restriction enzyme S subunit
MSKPSFLKLPCYILPYHEQQKIAKILASCDKVINLKEQLLAEKRRQKKWLLEKLLDPNSGVRLPGFRGKWEESPISELFQFGSSLSASWAQLSDTGICYLHYGDIHSNETHYIDIDNNYDEIPKINIPRINKQYLLHDGDVVFVDASEDYDGVSKFVVIKNPEDKPFIAGLHTVSMHNSCNKLNNEFKIYCFQSSFVKNQMNFLANGMKVFGLSKNSFAKIRIVYPEIKEQKAIANILFLADNEIDLLSKELEEWRIAKKALMQVLLTGIVRIDYND